MDKYEASVWRVPLPQSANKGLVKKIRQGKVTLADLEKGGATQLGVFDGGVFVGYAPCAPNGQNCLDDIYAASIPGVPASARQSWFQAQAACESSGKRLPSNAEWQVAASGTPDPGPDDGTTTCVTVTNPALTGSRPACVSTRGAFDMVGNLWEYVADWTPPRTDCVDNPWSVSLSASGDLQCLLAATATSGDPGVLVRGGGLGTAASAGPLALLVVELGGVTPDGGFADVGFRCAR
jgi:hypothetical protein